MRRHDALARIEMALVAEVVSSGVRHDLRNQITIIRGALFFLRRKVSGTEAWRSDARVGEFFKAIEEQLDRATHNVDPERLSERLFTRDVAPTELAACVRLAVEQTHVDPSVQLTVDVVDCPVEVDAREIAFAIRCLIENAEDAMPEGGRIEILGGPSPSGATALLLVRAKGPGFSPPSPSRQSQVPAPPGEDPILLGLTMAGRVCRRYGGRVAVQPADEGSLIELTLPLCMPPRRAV
ncbi:MAG: hypothetical protein U0441_18970 [Polyangiaceae bacterium]